MAGGAGRSPRCAHSRRFGQPERAGGFGSGKRLRLRGRGLAAAGDQFVVFDVRAPAAENDAQRRDYRDLAAAFGETVAQDAPAQAP